MTLLYVMTSDGDSVEDGSVYYATHLLVAAFPDEKPLVDAALARVLDIPEDASLAFPYDEGDTATFLFHMPDELARRMADEGWVVEVVEPTYITRYES